jgi:hypothetical protein
MRLGISSYTYTWAIGVPGFSSERPLDAVGLLRNAVALGGKAGRHRARAQWHPRVVDTGTRVASCNDCSGG